MAYGNTRKAYDVRVAHNKAKDGKEKVSVTFGEGVVKKIGAPYISIHKTDGKLVFFPHQKKTGNNGTVKLTTDPDRAQFSRADEIITLLDFIGEYPIKRDTQNGLYYIDLADKSGYSELHARTAGTTKVAETPKPEQKPKAKTEVKGLEEMLENAMDEKRLEWKALEEQRKQLQAKVDEIVAQMQKVQADINAYRTALEVAQGGK